jgi:hypothetical protein
MIVLKFEGDGDYPGHRWHCHVAIPDASDATILAQAADLGPSVLKPRPKSAQNKPPVILRQKDDLHAGVVRFDRTRKVRFSVEFTGADAP